MIEQVDLSERRACSLVGLSRDSYRHPPVADQKTAALSAAIINIAQARRRFGYRRIHDLLRPKFPDVNHKRIYRLYSAADLTVRKRRKAKRPFDRVVLVERRTASHKNSDGHQHRCEYLFHKSSSVESFA
jgi:putative transposase